jgi:hypothetical protein
MRLSLIPLVLGLCFSSALGQERYLKPVDEAAKDASFQAFRTRLIAAAEKHDAAFIYRILDPKIELSFGGDAGVADFKRIWKIDRKDSKFWDEFLRVIKNGGKFDGDGRNKFASFSAPYTFSSWPADLDSFDYSVIFGSDVNLRESPSPDAKIVERLSYNIVKPDYDRSKKVKDGPGKDDFLIEWMKVETLGGKAGFIRAQYVRSPIDYRAGFVKKRGVWRMTYFIAGD